MKKLILIAIVSLAVISCSDRQTLRREGLMHKLNLEITKVGDINGASSSFFMYKKDTLILSQDIHSLSTIQGINYDEMVRKIRDTDELDKLALIIINKGDANAMYEFYGFTHFQFWTKDKINVKLYKSATFDIRTAEKVIN